MSTQTRIIKVGDTLIGGGHRVSVQSMWKSPLTNNGNENDINKVAEKLNLLSELGCDLMRFSAPTIEQASLLGKLSAMVKMPLVADIHFDWRIALRCMDFPISKIRVNPGNLGEKWKLAEVVAKAKDKNIPLRIGVNSGSIPKDLANDVENGADRCNAVITAAERELEELDKLCFNNVVVSIKASSVTETINANRLFSQKHPEVPLHIGVTEAGPLVEGCVKNTVAIYSLLKDGIGDTIRVSLSSEPEHEVIAGNEIVSLVNGKKEYAELISCPRCGRNTFDTHAFTEKWRNRIYSIKKPVTIAIMGCVVNGPGEGKHADLGICGAGDSVILFKKGKIVQTTTVENADTVFEGELNKL